MSGSLFLDTAPDTIRTEQPKRKRRSSSASASLEALAMGPLGDAHVIVRKAVVIVSAATGIPQELIEGHNREPNVAMARHVACWLARKEGFSYPQIGREIRRDHATVISSVRNVEEAMATSERANAWVSRLQEVLREELAAE